MLNCQSKIKKSASIFLAVILMTAISSTAYAAEKTYDIFTYEVSSRKITITDCNEDADGEITVPDEIDGYSVTKIGNGAFKDCEDIEGLILPDSITKIESNAFKNCESLEYISIPESVWSIGYNAFYGCDRLEDVYYSSDEDDWDDISLLSGNENLTEADIHYESVISVQDDIFVYSIEDGEATLTDCDTDADGDIEIPDEIDGYTVTAIGSYAFYNCTEIESVSIPDTVTSIGYRAFYGCDSLEDVYYEGTEEEWDEISISSGNSDLTDADIEYESDSYGILFLLFEFYIDIIISIISAILS